MSGTASSPVGGFGKQVPALWSALRPAALDELAHWGGPTLVRGKRVLDLGCGDGRLALGVAAYARAVDGLDPDAELIALARRRARESRASGARFQVGAAQSLPYASGSFDVVISSWTL